MIEVADLTVRFGGVTSLDGMSLTFEQGTCGLIGPNGAGKTTFFNVLSGFVRPAAGVSLRNADRLNHEIVISCPSAASPPTAAPLAR